MTVDLCGIAKGYALDQMVSVLREHGEENFIVDLGGEVAALGHHPNGRSWQIAVEDPRHGHVRSAEIIALAGRAIATSGDKVNGYTLGGRRYSHIIDPTTEEPVEGAAASVSVIADNAMLADGWATALVSAGVKGPALAQRNGLDALFFFNEEASLRRVAVGLMSTWPEEERTWSLYRAADHSGNRRSCPGLMVRGRVLRLPGGWPAYLTMRVVRDARSGLSRWTAMTTLSPVSCERIIDARYRDADPSAAGLRLTPKQHRSWTSGALVGILTQRTAPAQP